MSQRRPVLVTFVVLLCLVGATMASAAPARWHRDLKAPPRSAPAAEVAWDYVTQNAARLGLERVEISPDARVIPWRGHRIVRMGQLYEGLEVFERVVVVRLDRDGRVRTVVTDAARRLDVVLVTSISADKAVNHAGSVFGAGHLSAPITKLGVFDDGNHGLLAWRVEATWDLRRWRIFVDALSGKVIHRRSLATGATGRVYAQNPVSTPTADMATLGNLPASATHLDGDWVTVYRYLDGTTSSISAIEDLTLDQTAVADASGIFDYPPTTDATPDFNDAFAEVNVYYHVDDQYTYFRDQHGYTTTRPYVAVANLGESANTPYANAFFTPVQWNGSQAYGLFLGQADTVDLGYDGDVIRHEFTHSVVHDLTNMAYGPMALPVYDTLGANSGPSAIHEGMADYFACTVTDDPVLGEYSLAAMGAPRTQLNDTTCPASVQGEGHADGEVWGGAVWAIRVELADAALADSLLYGSMATLTSNATFQDYAVAIADTATAMVGDGDLLQAQADAVDGILLARGMTGCGRALDMVSGESRTLINQFTYGAVAQMTGQTCDGVRGMELPALPLLFQFKMTVPANATALTFDIGFTPATDLQYDIYIRRGELVGFHMVSVMGGYFFLPEALTFDHHFGPLTSGVQSITLEPGGSPDLEVSTDYYFAVTNQNCDQGTASVTLEIETGGNPQPDAGPWADGAVTPDASGTDPGDGANDGCSCTHSGSTPLPTLLLLLGVFGWILRRRR
jgi:uncharacterized protein (TIGR03382 family)